MKNAIWIFLSIVLLISIESCHRSRPSPYTDSEDLTGLPARISPYGDDKSTGLMNKLQARGVKVISMGQDHLLVIPSDLIFAQQSPRVLWNSYALLNDVVCYLKQYQEITIDITAFCNKYVSPARERALTYARARAVARYIWSQDVDSRFIFIRGLGSDKPIQVNRSGGDDSMNSRIEITFRNVVA